MRSFVPSLKVSMRHDPGGASAPLELDLEQPGDPAATGIGVDGGHPDEDHVVAVVEDLDRPEQPSVLDRQQAEVREVARVGPAGLLPRLERRHRLRGQERDLRDG